MWVEFAGLLAAVVSTCILLPQIIKMVRTKTVEDISPWMLILTIIAQLLWIIYGYFRADVILTLSSIAALLFGLASTFLWHVYQEIPLKQLVYLTKFSRIPNDAKSINDPDSSIPGVVCTRYNTADDQYT